MNDEKPEQNADDNDFDLERRIEAQMRAERRSGDEEEIPEVELERAEPFEDEAEIPEFDEEDEPLEAKLLDDVPAVELERPDVSPEPTPYVDATPEPLTPTEAVISPLDSAEALQRRRDGDTLMMLGGFLGILALPVLIGSAFAGEQHAMIVNIASGAVLLAIGAGMFFRGRFVRRS